MSTRVGEQVDRSATSSDAGPIRTTRVDAGHVPANGAVDAALATDDVHTLVGAQAWESGFADERAEVDSHARQLGLELERRQAELDAREEELNRRSAEMDQELRRARLWLEERRREIEEREVEIGSKRADVEARLERVVASEHELQAVRSSKQRENERAISECDVPASAFVPVVELVAAPTAQVNTALADQLATRERRLKESETLLAAEYRTLAETQQRFAEEKVAWQTNMQSERRAWDEQRSRQETAFARRHAALVERAQQLDARGESLEQLQRDLAAGQRETLELRVAVQELWLQLSGRMAPASMMQAIAESRAKLAANYRSVGGEFEAAEKRLRHAAEQLAKQVSDAKEQRRQFQTWADERQAAIERQAARLVAREQELDAQDQSFREQERAWHEQKQAFRREIRRLLGELRECERAEGVGRD